jgi:hypothetical protein
MWLHRAEQRYQPAGYSLFARNLARQLFFRLMRGGKVARYLGWCWFFIFIPKLYQNARRPSTSVAAEPPCVTSAANIDN